jgi:hypothetical protein
VRVGDVTALRALITAGRHAARMWNGGRRVTGTQPQGIGNVPEAGGVLRGGSLVRARLIRRLSLLLALVAALALLWVRDPALHAKGFGSPGSQDFIQYWSAARIASGGGNPYDSEALLAVQRTAGWLEPKPVLIWNPPWTLAVVLPLGLLPFGLATQVWLLLQLGLILGSGLLLWRYFAPGDARYWIGPLLAAAFVPGLLALRMGQISPWLLVGVVVFLCAERSRRDLLAGSALALLMIKPHVTYLFCLAALWWIWRTRRWRMLTGWLAALGGASACVLVLAPDIHRNYMTATSRPPLYWVTATLGAWLRLFLGEELQCLQFAPSVVGALALMLWLGRRRGAWRWEVAAPPLLLASTLTAAYGWSTDQVVLLPVVVAMFGRLSLASRTRSAMVLAAWAMSQLGLVTQNLVQMHDLFYFWHPFVLAGLYRWSASDGRDDDVADGGERAT